MSDFIILDNVELPEETLAAIRRAVAGTGISEGSLVIGWFKHMPDSYFLMWTAPASLPVIHIDRISRWQETGGVECVMQSFIAKWAKAQGRVNLGASVDQI